MLTRRSLLVASLLGAATYEATGAIKPREETTQTIIEDFLAETRRRLEVTGEASVRELESRIDAVNKAGEAAAAEAQARAQRARNSAHYPIETGMKTTTILVPAVKVMTKQLVMDVPALEWKRTAFLLPHAGQHRVRVRVLKTKLVMRGLKWTLKTWWADTDVLVPTVSQQDRVEAKTPALGTHKVVLGVPSAVKWFQKPMILKLPAFTARDNIEEEEKAADDLDAIAASVESRILKAKSEVQQALMIDSVAIAQEELERALGRLQAQYESAGETLAAVETSAREALERLLNDATPAAKAQRARGWRRRCAMWQRSVSRSISSTPRRGRSWKLRAGPGPGRGRFCRAGRADLRADGIAVEAGRADPCAHAGPLRARR